MKIGKKIIKNLKVAFFLGYRSILKSNRATLVLMILIMSLAFVNLMFISSVLGGIIVSINKQIKTNIVSNVIITPQEKPVKKDFIAHTNEIQNQIELIPGVVSTARHYKLAGTIGYDRGRNGKYIYKSAEIIGMDPEKEKNMSEISRKIIEGRYLEGFGNEDVLIGSDVAGGYGGDELNSLGGARVGDKIKITFSNGVMRDYKIRGIFKVNFGFADRIVFITAKEAESILSVYDSASQILVKTEAVGDESQQIERIKNLTPNLEVKSWTEYMGPLQGISKSFDIITIMISTIGLVVVAITIFILIYVNVIHKRRQIGILKAIGISKSIIIYSYVFQAIFYAVSGVIIGLLLIVYVIAPYFIDHPLDLPIGETSLALDNVKIVQGIISLIFAAFVAGFIPSRQAARENILSAIWGT